MKQKTIDGIIHIKIAAVFKETVFHTEFTLTISVYNTNICAWTSKLKKKKKKWYEQLIFNSTKKNSIVSLFSNYTKTVINLKQGKICYFAVV